MKTFNPAALRDALARIVGPAHVLVATDNDPLTRHLSDWRQRYHGQAAAIVRPASTEEVAEVLRCCAAHGHSVVPQGGNTSLVGGSVPDASGHQVVLSLQRLNRVRAIDVTNLTMQVEAGCTLADVQAAAQDAGLLFPLSLGSQGSCTIGGNLATNAGGTQVLRYGTARELCLGLEVVMADGTVLPLMQGLRKNNMGYDLRDLFIGSEGTLGVITAATLRLYPRPAGTATALVHCVDLAATLALLRGCRTELEAGLTAFESMGALPLALVHSHLPDVAQVLHGLDAPRDKGWVTLIEYSSAESAAHAHARLEGLLVDVLADTGVFDALLAHNEAQRQAMWALREAIPLAEKIEGRMIKHDIGLPSSAIADFVREAEAALTQRWPGVRVVCFGHLGDGNLHYNVQPPHPLADEAAWCAFEREANGIVFDLVMRHQGTLSAEHGIGVLRREELVRHAPAPVIGLMRTLKQALDPDRLLNPGRVVD